jgi:hypothetical protein
MGSLQGSYLTAFPRDAIKGLTGFAKGEPYFIFRDSVIPSQELQNQIFSFVEYCLDEFLNRDTANQDKSTYLFLELLKFLRNVIL